MAYLYDDEDNAPMNDEAFDRIDQNGHNPTVYPSYAEMRAVEKPLPFTDSPDNGCWNCIHYDGDRCHYAWNNNDECYYNPETDDKDPDDWCPGWEIDENAIWEDYHETDSGCTMDP
jgi:hypothetical protein